MLNFIVRQLLLLVVLCLAATLKAEPWNYPTPGPEGDLREEESWGGICDTGRRQSPIDIHQKAAVKGAYPQFAFVGFDEPLKDASYINNGHTVQIDAAADSAISIYGGGLRNKYVFEQMHFHWSSEHTLNGERYGLEAHLVHRNAKFNTVTEAAAEKAGIAVLAILFRVTDQPNEAIAKILNETSTIRALPQNSIQLRSNLKLQDLLPKTTSKYFRYEGSLTTPVCAESVVWTVFPETVPITLGQLEEFKTFRDLENHELILNYRSLKPLNLRVLVLVDDTDPSEDSSSTTTLISRVTMLLPVVLLLLRNI